MVPVAKNRGDQRKKAAIRFALMAAIKEARGKLDLRKREQPNFIYARNLRRTNPAIPIRPVESTSRLAGSGVDIPCLAPAQLSVLNLVPFIPLREAMLPVL